MRYYYFFTGLFYGLESLFLLIAPQNMHGSTNSIATTAFGLMPIVLGGFFVMALQWLLLFIRHTSVYLLTGIWTITYAAILEISVLTHPNPVNGQVSLSGVCVWGFFIFVHFFVFLGMRNKKPLIEVIGALQRFPPIETS